MTRAAFGPHRCRAPNESIAILETIMNDFNETNVHIESQIPAFLAGGLTDAEEQALAAHVAACPACAQALESARSVDADLVDRFASAVPAADFEDRLLANLRPSIGRSARFAGASAARWFHPAVRKIATGIAAALVLGATGYGVTVGLERQQQHAARGDAKPFAGDGGKQAALASPMEISRNARSAAPTDFGTRTESASASRDTSGSAKYDEILLYPADWPAVDSLKRAEEAPLERAQERRLASGAPAEESEKANRTEKGESHSRTYRGNLGDARRPSPANESFAIRSDGTRLSTDAGKDTARSNSPADVAAGWRGPGSSSLPIQTPQIELDGVATKRTVSVPDGGTLFLGGQKVYGTTDLSTVVPDFSDAPDFNLQSAKQSAGKFGTADDSGPNSGDRASGARGLLTAPELEREMTFKPADDWQENRGKLAAIGGEPEAKPGQNKPNEDKPAAPAVVAVVAPVKAAPSEPPAVEPAAKPAMARRIIRNGDVTFEVDSFDAALAQISKIAGEEQGVIAATASDKQPNGKVSGTVTVRCPPERLDTLVLKLRGIGDLKSQRIAAADVTKQYTDLEAQLRAGKAMEGRLLEIIKTGGAVKDLLEAEKQLGVWRERIERIEGEIRYYNDLISLSTLVVTLNERDVRSPTAAFETETIAAGLEADDVEKARAETLSAIEKAKGRVIDSNLSRKEGDQYEATIEAELPPDAAGPVIDRLRQLGRVARLDVTRKTTTQGGAGPIVAGLKVERQDTRLSLSIYNLTLLAPRQTTAIVVAAADVEGAYKAFLAQAAAAGGRVVSSQLNRPQADQAVGTMELQLPTAGADAMLATLRAGVDVMRMSSTVNVDKQNTTEAKRGFTVTINSLAHVPPRETTSLTVFSSDVPGAFAKLTEAARAAGGRIVQSQLSEQDPANRSALLAFDVPREKWPAVEAVLKEAGLAVSRSVTRSQDTETTVDSKIRLVLSLLDEIRLTPREAIDARVAAADVPATFAALVEAAKVAGARAIGSNLDLNDRAHPVGRIRFTTARESAEKFESALRAAGLVIRRTVSRQADGPTTVDTRVGFEVTVISESMLVARENVRATVATANVPQTHAALVTAARAAGAGVVNSNLQLNDPANPSGELAFAIDRGQVAAFESAMAKAGMVIGKTVNRPPEAGDMVESKVGYSITVSAERSLTPREDRRLTVVAPSARERFTRMLEVLRASDAYVLVSQLAKEDGVVRGRLLFVIDRASLPTIEKALVEGGGDILEPQVERSADTAGTVDHLVRVSVTLVDADQQGYRQSYTLAVETKDLSKAAGDLEALAVQVGGRTLESTRAADDRGAEAVARLVLNVPLARAAEVVAAARGQGQVTMASVERNDKAPEGSQARAVLTITLGTPGSSGLSETVRGGFNTGLAGLLKGLQYIIIGLLLLAPVLIGWWLIRSLLKRRRRSAELGPEITPA